MMCVCVCVDLFIPGEPWLDLLISRSYLLVLMTSAGADSSASLIFFLSSLARLLCSRASSSSSSLALPMLEEQSRDSNSNGAIWRKITEIKESGWEKIVWNVSGCVFPLFGALTGADQLTLIGTKPAGDGLGGEKNCRAGFRSNIWFLSGQNICISQ